MKLALTGGTTSVSLLVFIQDTTSTTGAGLTGLVFNTASLTAYYARPGAAATAITLATQTVAGAFSSGGFVEVDPPNMPGVYRFDIPDAALAAGVTSVVAMLKGAANMAPLLLEIQLSPMPSNLTQIDGAATTGNNATLNLKQLNIVNNAGTALVASSTGSNGHGIEASGNGSGYGLSSAGGATGHGIHGIGGATSGDGMRLTANVGTNSNGLTALGIGTGRGIDAEGTSSGAGIYVVSGNGVGIDVSVAAGNNHAVRATGSGTGSGIIASGGSTSGSGLRAVGGGSGSGILATAGATGHGISATGGATSGDGINAAAPTAGDGMHLTGAGGGNFDLNATTTDALEVTTTNVTAPALAAFFTVDSGETYATAVAGSVVKETADNVTIGGIAAGVLNDIADAILRRDWTAVAAPAARSLMNAARAIRNRVRINAGTMTVYQEDDATPAWTAPVTTDAAALPIVEIDPT